MMTEEKHEDPGFETEPSSDHDHSGSHDGAGTWEKRCERLAVEMKEKTCEVSREMENAVMSLIPPKVTRELVNAHKEVVRAGQRLGDIVLNGLEERAKRAESLHKKRDEA
ncbi:MAG: hypothetical protein JJU11_04080 [Candidatus Sumerlaeia bacterium]|nr:hypothetical protein [Candidatus Sumerlaeia bacterium]